MYVCSKAADSDPINNSSFTIKCEMGIKMLHCKIPQNIFYKVHTFAFLNVLQCTSRLLKQVQISHKG